MTQDFQLPPARSKSLNLPLLSFLIKNSTSLQFQFYFWKKIPLKTNECPLKNQLLEDVPSRELTYPPKMAF